MNKKILLTIPGKTFLAGEYLALKGLGAIVFSSKPKFEFLIEELSEQSLATGISSQNPFHEKSPAGQFWREKEEFFRRYSIQIKSFSRLGGWGASTAEFIALHALYQLQETLWIEQERIFDLHQILKDYRRLSGKPILGFAPSGADLVAQVRGGITYFDGQNGKIQTFSWPFESLKMKLIATGNKLPTHEHLQALSDFATEDLASAVHLCHQALKLVDEKQFVAGLIVMAETLAGLGFVAAETQVLLRQFDLPGVLVAKGCGALGADVIAVFYKDQTKDQTEMNVGTEIDLLAKRLGLQIVATESSLCEGLSVQRVAANKNSIHRLQEI